jgi:hypothetical protein
MSSGWFHHQLETNSKDIYTFCKMFGYSTKYSCIEVGPPLITGPTSWSTWKGRLRFALQMKMMVLLAAYHIENVKALM